MCVKHQQKDTNYKSNTIENILNKKFINSPEGRMNLSEMNHRT